MTRLILCSTLLLASLAHADAFAWADGTTVLTDAKGQTLTWTIARGEGQVRITGVHPKWQVEHLAKPDGAPISTVRKAAGNTVKVTWSDEGVKLERTDAKGKTSTATIKEKGLWDSDTLDARLAGIAWSKDKKVKLRVPDVDAADGTVYPLVAEYEGEKKCGAAPCHHVLLALDDFRRLFAPTFEYRYSTSSGAKYLQHDGDGMTFKSSWQ
jgi:YD repeat-containing protein